MLKTRVVFKSNQTILPDGPTDLKLKPACIVVENGIITEVFDPKDCSLPVTYDFGSLIVMSGIVDTHAHINEPGRTEWEGFETATHAAALGGITSVIDMPLNSIPATTSLMSLEIKKKSALRNCHIDYGFWGGVIPGNAHELESMINAGVMGFKCFLCPSGVDEFPHVNESNLRIAMPILARHGIPLIVHAEIESHHGLLSSIPDDNPATTPDHSHSKSYQSYLNSRPASWEVDAIKLMIKLCRETRCRVHIVHLSAADALGEIKKAKAEGLPFTVETCPHYLTFDAESIMSGATEFKCAPPIRSKKNLELLWTAVQEGVIDFIVSDHSPCTPRLKLKESGDFSKAWGGIAGLQFSLSAVWTEMRKRQIPITRLSQLMSLGPAQFIGMAHKKGALSVGADADLIVFDPDQAYTVSPDLIRHKHKITPYSGSTLYGVVTKTYLRGNLISDQIQNTELQMHPQEKSGQWIHPPLKQP